MIRFCAGWPAVVLATVFVFAFAPASSFAQAPAGGYGRCVAAGNSPAYCADRGRKIAAGLIQPDANFGRGPKAAPGSRKRH
jgi:hypothetical protein